MKLLYRLKDTEEALVTVVLPTCPKCFTQNLGITNHLQIGCAKCLAIFLRIPEPIENTVSPSKSGGVVPGKKNRHERMMDVRVRLAKDYMDPEELMKAVDHLFFELDQLIHEVEELKAAARMKL